MDEEKSNEQHKQESTQRTYKSSPFGLMPVGLQRTKRDEQHKHESTQPTTKSSPFGLKPVGKKYTPNCTNTDSLLGMICSLPLHRRVRCLSIADVIATKTRCINDPCAPAANTRVTSSWSCTSPARQHYGSPFALKPVGMGEEKSRDP